MAQQSTVVASLVANPVPSGRECVTNLTEILQGVVDFVGIDVLASVEQGSPFPASNNTAAQALSTAQAAQAAANQALQAQPQTRYTGSTPITLASGDSFSQFTFGTPMPSADYSVQVTYFGPDSGTGAFNFHVVTDSRTVGGCTIRFNNTPANFSYTAVAVENKSNLGS